MSKVLISITDGDVFGVMLSIVRTMYRAPIQIEKVLQSVQILVGELGCRTFSRKLNFFELFFKKSSLLLRLKGRNRLNMGKGEEEGVIECLSQISFVSECT
jgi:hypothetical protein